MEFNGSREVTGKLLKPLAYMEEGFKPEWNRLDIGLINFSVRDWQSISLTLISFSSEIIKFDICGLVNPFK